MANNIIDTPIIHEVEQSFLDYSLSVITDRAIPSAEDGLKPVARRILWDMFDKGYFNNKKFVKCAQPVGDTMGRYHPHGDSSIYGALVWLSQPWNMRYPLIDFHGNNGSRDGDEPAAYRYTECKLSKAGEEMLANIKKNTVDWQLAYTDEEEEPIYLPGYIPNLIVNGTSGIAVAMACSFAPHNLCEVMQGAIEILKNPNCTVDDLMKYIPGPDFPTGGIIINKDELRSAYMTGKGRARVRGEYIIESTKNGDNIVFTSIPYKVSKEELLKTIDKLCEDGLLEGVTGYRDETNLEGVRFVIELAKNVSATPIIAKLFKLTDLETTYSINQVALVDKKPKLLSLKQMIEIYIEHQRDVLIRKTKFDLVKVEARINILNGLLKALANIDNIIAMIKKSESAAAAKDNLMITYGFNEPQAKAILDMKLSRLAKLETVEINDEKNALVEEQTNLNAILAAPDVKLIEEFERINLLYGDSRRTIITQVVTAPEEKEIEFVEPEKCVVVMTQSGLIKRIAATAFKVQKRNGKGVKTQDDITSQVIRTNTIDNLMIFTNKGKIYRLLVNDIPVGTNLSQGQSLKSLLTMDEDEQPTIIYSMYRDTDAKFVLFTTTNGLVKKTLIEEYLKTKKKTGVPAIGLKEGDSLASAVLIKDEPILMVTSKGMVIHFDSTEIGPTGRTAAGMKGMLLGENDYVIACVPIRDINDDLAIFTKSGLAKRVVLSEFPKQKRGGKGLACHKITLANDPVIAVSLVNDTDIILIVGATNSICISASEISRLSRISSGSQIIKSSTITSVSKV